MTIDYRFVELRIDSFYDIPIDSLLNIRIDHQPLVGFTINLPSLGASVVSSKPALGAVTTGRPEITKVTE